jgi:hypothetical protein
MIRVVTAALHALDLSLLQCASLMVPGVLRAEWRREWRSELWHVRRASAPPSGATFGAECDIVAFCLGAYQDAWCLRRHAQRNKPAASLATAAFRGSAAQCLLMLVAVFVTTYALALFQPEVRMATHSSRSAARSGLILIQVQDQEGPTKAVIPFERYHNWSLHSHLDFDGFAFYRMSREEVTAGAEPPSRWRVALSSANLFALLGFPIQLMGNGEISEPGLPQMILSYTLWKNEFGGNPGIVGSLLRIGRRQVKIVGVAADRVWKLPGQPDAWLLEPDLAILGAGAGHIIAHLTRQGRAEMWADRVNITVYNPDHSEQDYLGTSISEHTPTPWDLYRFAVLLALLALPAVTSVSLSEYSVSSHRPPWPRRLARGMYLGGKLTLLLPIAYYASLDCAYWHASQHSPASEYAQLFSTFVICLFGFRWAILDQRQRCPVCLKRVAHPAQVGLASRTFLAWNGTELICTGGHTLLHVPSLPTSWFGAQRWLYLDSSWEFLFAGTDAG